jgi:copper chaperone
MATITLNVSGMKCGGCEKTVRETVSALTGVHSVEPSFKENRVTVDYDESQISVDKIKQAITAKEFVVS